METQSKIKKVLFYTGSSYGFRSFAIWHVYEISQVYPVILLSEKLDSETEKILNDKRFFPKLEKIIPACYPSDSLKLMIMNNKALYKKAEDVIRDHGPDIVVTGGSYQYPFPLYIRRIAKRVGAINICHLLPKYFKEEEMAARSKLISAYLGKFYFFPSFVSLFLSGFRKRLGHFLYYWILPLSVGERPFTKESSPTLYTKSSGKSADYYYCFSEEDRNSYLKEGIPAEKLYILRTSFPDGFKKIYEILGKSLKEKIIQRPDEKILTFMWPESEIGINRENFSLISKEELRKQRIKTLTLIAGILKGWKIIIKAHPLTKSEKISEIKETYGSISPNIMVVDPSGWSDVYVQISDVIMGSAPTSFSIYNASMTYPEKPILSLDFGKELVGGGFKNYNSIEYIDKEDRFVKILEKIRDNKYCKNYPKKTAEQKGPKDFFNFLGMIEYLFDKKK